MSKRKAQDEPDHKSEPPTVFSLKPERMAELIGIGSDISDSDESIPLEADQEKAGLLHRRLEEKLPLDSSESKMLPENLGQMRSTIGLLASETIGELLESASTGQAVTRRIKDHFKALSETARSEAEYETANTIYYAAIAHALVYHEVKITGFACEDLSQSFDFLMEQEWIQPHLRNLFQKACEKCRDKK